MVKLRRAGIVAAAGVVVSVLTAVMGASSALAAPAPVPASTGVHVQLRSVYGHTPVLTAYGHMPQHHRRHHHHRHHHHPHPFV